VAATPPTAGSAPIAVVERTAVLVSPTREPATETPAPSPTPAPATPAPPLVVRHEVARGETLTSIATLYRVAVTELMAANGLQSDRIFAGATLLIPQ
jgi:N-acetylmuramoyl-L-alanine amidase